MWYWAALKPFESAFQLYDDSRKGYIEDLKTLNGVKRRLSKIKGSNWADKMDEVPCRIEVYMYSNPYYISSYRKVIEWAI